MFNTLRVTVDGVQLDESGKANLEDLYRTAVIRTVAPSTAQLIRLLFRREQYGMSVEPFVGSAAFEALLSIPKKRREVMTLLRTLVACTFLVCERVGILRMGESHGLPKTRMDLSFEALRDQHCPKRGWYSIIAVPLWFHFPQVEAKLLQPLALTSGQVATHYFREFWIRAVERQSAHDAVMTIVTRDRANIVAFGDVLNESPPSQTELQNNIRAAGRVYFTDRR